MIQSHTVSKASGGLPAMLSTRSAGFYVQQKRNLCKLIVTSNLRPVQGSQSSKELLQAGQEAADAVQCYEGTAAPTDGTLLVAEGSEPAEFAAALQLPHGFAAQPCAAYDSDFAVS